MTSTPSKARLEEDSYLPATDCFRNNAVTNFFHRHRREQMTLPPANLSTIAIPGEIGHVFTRPFARNSLFSPHFVPDEVRVFEVIGHTSSVHGFKGIWHFHRLKPLFWGVILIVSAEFDHCSYPPLNIDAPCCLTLVPITSYTFYFSSC